MTSPHRITLSPRRNGAVAALAAALLLSACGGGTPRVDSTPAPPAAKRWIGREDVAEAITLLNAGKVKPARKLLAKVLKRQPDDAVAAQLMKQVDTDPVALLGSESFPYTTRPSDSFSSLSLRYLGDPMMFYALSRYNGVDVPSSLTAGRIVKIPGKLRVDLPPPEKPSPTPKPSAPAAKAPPSTPKPASPTPAAAPTPARTPQPAAAAAQAAKLRAAGLEQMNRGAINRAVALLRQASALAPGNALIRRDLERATRIQKTVHGR